MSNMSSFVLLAVLLAPTFLVVPCHGIDAACPAGTLTSTPFKEPGPNGKDCILCSSIMDTCGIGCNSNEEGETICTTTPSDCGTLVCPFRQKPNTEDKKAESAKMPAKDTKAPAPAEGKMPAKDMKAPAPAEDKIVETSTNEPMNASAPVATNADPACPAGSLASTPYTVLFSEPGSKGKDCIFCSSTMEECGISCKANSMEEGGVRCATIPPGCGSLVCPGEQEANAEDQQIVIVNAPANPAGDKKVEPINDPTNSEPDAACPDGTLSSTDFTEPGPNGKDCILCSSIMEECAISCNFNTKGEISCSTNPSDCGEVICSANSATNTLTPRNGSTRNRRLQAF